MNFTDNEMNLLNWVAFNEMTPFNGERPDNADDASCFFWVDEIAKDIGLTQDQVKGVAGSLVAKGAIYTIHENNPNDSIIGMSSDGFAAWDQS